ncbi:OLC1v1016820C1 [Oldenlandia corymbosa var. corymbosa]|uniref:OLC1v1016820C1 n=1 Tax=Oldenlandia corymbosa var. corymbosa TaxID=529605 RepID=A0AAV1E7Z5_OLDCO|nr:OLC1v1016820C1 [Oldenlandia corymbosa var. corymbosa]
MINTFRPSLEPQQLSSLSSLPFFRSEIQKPKSLLSHFTPQKPPKLPSLSHSNSPHKNSTINACGASNCEIDMVRNREGVYSAKPKKVVVLWDLDNKPPRGPPYEAAMALKRVAQHFGEVVDISAYANRHAFIHLPQWVVEERRERKRIDIMERKGISTPSEPYICSVCGRKCKTHFDLKKHFKQLHERERQKKVNRMRQLKGKKRQRFKERFIDGNDKYNEAARTLIFPKVGYGLASELRRAGVFVKTVEDKPQAADWAVKRQMQHSMSRGIDWLFLVSDDSDFSDMLRKAREANLGTVVVGDGHRALGKQADLWVPWAGVQNGEITEADLVPRRRSEFTEKSDRRFSVSEFDGGLNRGESTVSFVDELFGSTEFGGVRYSAFSEGEEEDDEDWLRIEIRNSTDDGGNDDENGDYLLDSEDEWTPEDGYV